jgi:hypothetical protein
LGDYVVAADANDRLLAWWRTSGEVAWRSEQLLYRILNTPTVVGNQFAFGDSEGYIHLISPTDGSLRKRLTTNGKGLTSPLVSIPGWLLAVSQSGDIDAFRIE